MAGSVANLLLRIISQKGDASSDVEQLAVALEALDHASATATAEVETDQLSFDALVTELEAFDKSKFDAKAEVDADFSQLELFTQKLEGLASKTFTGKFFAGGAPGRFTQMLEHGEQLKLDLDTGPAEHKLHAFEQLVLHAAPRSGIPLVDLREHDIEQRGRIANRAIRSLTDAFGSMAQAGAGLGKTFASIGEDFGGVTVNLGMFGLKLGPIVALVLALVAAIAVSLVAALGALAASAILAATALGALAIALAAAIVPMIAVAIPAFLAFAKVLKALKKNQQDAALAAQQKAQADAQARQYSQQHADAVRNLGEATQRSADAQKSAYREMQDAIERVSDSLRSLQQAQLSQDQARLNVEKADLALKKFRRDAGLADKQFDAMFKTFTDVSFDPSKLNAALARVKTPGGGGLDEEEKLNLKQLILDRKQARLDEKGAIDNVSDAERDHTRAVQDALPFQQQGIKASQNYKSALDGVATAQRNLNRLEADRKFQLQQDAITKTKNATEKLSAQNQKLLGNVKILIKNLKFAFGPATTALLAGFTSGMGLLGGAVRDLRNPLTRLGKAMGNTVRDFFKAMSGADAQNLFTSFIDGATKLAPLIGSIFGSFLSILSKIARAAMPFLVEGFRWLAHWLGDIDKNTSVRDIRDWIADLIPHLKQWIKLAIQLVPGFFEFLKDVGPDALELLKWVTGLAIQFKNWSTSEQGRKDIHDFFNNSITVAKALANTIIFLVGIFSTLNDVFGWIRNAAGDFFDFFYNRSQDFFDFFYGLGGSVSDLKDTIVNTFNLITGFLGGLPSEFFQFGSDMIVGLINGIASYIGGIWTSITDSINSFIAQFKAFFGIGSPSTLFYSFGADIIRGLINGIRDFAVGIFEPLYSAISGIFSYLSGLATQFFGLGASIASGFANGIKSTASTVAGDWLTGVKDIWNAGKSFFGVGSPSKLMMELGLDVGKGFELGINASADGVSRAATRSFGAPVVAAATTPAGTASASGAAVSGVTIQNQTVNLPVAPGHDQMGDPRHQAAQFALEMRRRGRR